MIDVSVILSTHNRADLLDEALDALARQRARDVRFEVIAVDNDSTDHTPDVLSRWAARCPFVRHAREPRRGVSWGRNRGASLASAPILAFTDDDVRVAPDWVATMKESLDAAPDLAFVGGKVLPVWQSAPPPWLTREQWGPLAVLEYGDSPFLIGPGRPLCLLSANLAVRREAFEAVGGFATAFHRCQDHELLVRLWRLGRSGLYDPRLVVDSPVAPERLTKRYHMMWHRRNAAYHAMMAPRDVFWSDKPVSDLVLICGVPAPTFRQLGAELWGMVKAGGGRHTFAHRLLATYYAQYILHRFKSYRASARGSVVGDAKTGLMALLRKKLVTSSAGRARA